MKKTVLAATAAAVLLLSRAAPTGRPDRRVATADMRPASTALDEVTVEERPARSPPSRSKRRSSSRDGVHRRLLRRRQTVERAQRVTAHTALVSGTSGEIVGRPPTRTPNPASPRTRSRSTGASSTGRGPERGFPRLSRSTARPRRPGGGDLVYVIDVGRRGDPGGARARRGGSGPAGGLPELTRGDTAPRRSRGRATRPQVADGGHDRGRRAESRPERVVTTRAGCGTTRPSRSTAREARRAVRRQGGSTRHRRLERASWAERVSRSSSSPRTRATATAAPRRPSVVFVIDILSAVG